MQLGHSHRQLLSRCTLRWYSVGTAPAGKSSDVITASGTPAPPRLKRPLASSFGGIDIQNVAVPTQSTSQRFHKKTVGPSRSRDSSDQSPDVRRTSQPERNRGMRRDGASSPSDWGDGLVSLSFSSRLKLHQKKLTTRDTGTEPRLQEAQSRQQKSHQAQHTQMHGPRHGQRRQEQGDNASQMNRRRSKTEKSSSASTVEHKNRASARITDAEINEALSMTRPSSFKLRPQSSTRPDATAAAASNAAISKADSAPARSSSTATATQPTSTSSDRKARLAVLSSTNLNALFGTSTPTTGTSLTSLASSTSTSASVSSRDRVQGVLERSAGDYSRFLPRHVGVPKNVSRLPALRSARHALGTQRDVSLEQRRVAMHIIGGLVQPRREARA